MTREIQELVSAAEQLLRWQPICSLGSAGDLRQRRLKAALKAIDTASVAQLVQQGTCNAPFGGSTPSAGSNFKYDCICAAFPHKPYCSAWNKRRAEEFLAGSLRAAGHVNPESFIAARRRTSGENDEPSATPCSHADYDTQTGVCHRCLKTGLPIIYNRRESMRFIDICRVALGAKCRPLCPIAAKKTQGHFCCTRDAGHVGSCAAVPLDGWLKPGESVVGGTPNPCSVGSSPASPAICQADTQADTQADGYAGPFYDPEYDAPKISEVQWPIRYL